VKNNNNVIEHVYKGVFVGLSCKDEIFFNVEVCNTEIYDLYLDTFTKLLTVTARFVMSVCPPVRRSVRTNNSALDDIS
jgi:hypothetical protein